MPKSTRHARTKSRCPDPPTAPTLPNILEGLANRITLSETMSLGLLVLGGGISIRAGENDQRGRKAAPALFFLYYYYYY